MIEETNDEAGPGFEAEEVEEVMAALRALIQRASIPVVRACLEEAHDDIAHLTGFDAAAPEESADAA